MKALLIIDMQQLSFTPETPRFNTIGVVERINRLSEKFRKNNEPVIFIQHDGSKDGFCIPNTKEWCILDSLEIEATDIVVSKTANDSFYKSELHHILQEKGIQELIITGCATDFCVDSTVKSGVVKDYKVSVISDSHTTTDRPHLAAEKIIEHYNWMWDEMIPVNGKINVISFTDFIADL